MRDRAPCRASIVKAAVGDRPPLAIALGFPTLTSSLIMAVGHADFPARADCFPDERACARAALPPAAVPLLRKARGSPPCSMEPASTTSGSLETRLTGRPGSRAAPGTTEERTPTARLSWPASTQAAGDLRLAAAGPQRRAAGERADGLARDAAAAGAGWRPLPDPAAAQTRANQGDLVLAAFENPDPDMPGHIAIVRPSDVDATTLEAQGPFVTQAGGHNALSTPLARGFRKSPRGVAPRRRRLHSLLCPLNSMAAGALRGARQIRTATGGGYSEEYRRLRARAADRRSALNSPGE